MSFRIYLREIMRKEHAVKLEGQLDLTPMLRHESEIAGAEPLSVHLQAFGNHGIVSVSGKCDTVLELICARCLGQFRYPLDVTFHERFQEQGRGHQERHRVESKDVESDEDDLNVVQTEHVDLAPYLEQAVWLSVPYAPLCHEECQGLCPSCGINKNEQTCGCSTEDIDPRLAGLKNLLQ